MRKMMMAAVAATALISTAAIASVTFDNTTGVGFVGKGDVQLVYGQNNAAIQNALIANPQAYTFSYVESTSYDVTCEWTTVTGGKKPKTIFHAVTNTKTSSITSAINGAPRQTKGQNQFTGFNLSGIASTITTGGTVPSVGDACPQGGGNASSDPEENDALVTLVEMSPDNVPGSLYVTYLGNTQPLPITPIVVTTTL